jgi:dolichol-phosphate mannosyltransferase
VAVSAQQAGTLSTVTPTSVTIIVPCCNEELGIPALLMRLERVREQIGQGWDVLFVDDGSSDGTFGKLLSATRSRPWLRVVRHPTNLGLGAALRTGFDNARTPVVCTIDSDCTYAPERLPELVGLVERGADIATASAWHPESAVPEGGPIRIALSRFVSSLYKILIGQDVHTFTCLFRAYRTDRLARIRFRSNGFAAVAEIMLRGMLDGYVVRELPMRLETRRFGESKLKIGDAIMSHVGLLTLTATLVGARAARVGLRRSAA